MYLCKLLIDRLVPYRDVRGCFGESWRNYIPVDFVIMDINEDFQIPIILGRPFLATTGTIMDVKRGKLNFKVEERKIEFILAKLLKNPSLRDS